MRLAVGGDVVGVVHRGRVGVVDHLGRSDVVEEPAPLVERDNEDGVVQVAGVGKGVVGVGGWCSNRSGRCRTRPT